MITHKINEILPKNEELLLIHEYGGGIKNDDTSQVVILKDLDSNIKLKYQTHVKTLQREI